MPQNPCPSCTEPIPEKARFCPSCGLATPQSLNTTTGQVVAAAVKPPTEEGADQRDRLQRALGEGLKIRRLLGRGGFAEVWAAFDVRLKREVAVKTLRYDLVISDALLERFQREAEAVAKLRHPNIIPIYEVGEGEGIAYFVMPMIEGESLGEALDREGTISVDETCRILREAGGALAAAHRAGIVHRDIKPDNLMLEGPERRPIVMDFGIAKATSSSEARLTGTGMAMGTPHYMSPEQASGGKELDARADQYALALVGYRMLAGRLPFEADSIQTMIMKQITEVPRPVMALRPEVPRQLSDALARALSKDPAARFATMEEFVAAIPAAVGVATGITSRRRPTDTELARFPGAIMPKWNEPLVLLGVLCVLLVAGLVWWDRVPREIAAGRSNAMFAGRAFLTKQGASGAYDEEVDLAAEDTALTWLGKHVGPKTADTSAQWSRLLYHWTLTWSRANAKGRSGETWTVGVAPSSEINSFSRPMFDTAAGARLSADSAAKVAIRFLRDLDIDVTGLKRVMDSTISRKSRADHLFRWEDTKHQIVAGTDTAAPRYAVTIAGDRVRQFRASLRPASHPTVDRGSAPVIAGTGVIALLAVIVGIGAIILIIQRQRTDELRWRLATRIAVVAALLVGVQNLTEARITDVSTGLVTVFGIVLIGAFFVMAIVAGIVAGESLANEINPPALVGLETVSRFRVAAPDWLPPILRGMAVGAVMAAADAARHTIPAFTMWRHGTLSSAFNQSAVWLSPVADVGWGLSVGAAVLFLVHFVGRFAKRAWVPLVLPGLFVATVGMFMKSALEPWPSPIGVGVIVAALCFAGWRYGLLAAAAACWTWQLLQFGVSLATTGLSLYVGGGFACLIALVALPALSLVARRRAE